MMCPKCGSWNESNSNFCSMCGNSLTVNNNGMNPMMMSNGMNPMIDQNQIKPIKPKKNYPWIIILSAISCTIIVVVLSICVVRVGMRSDETAVKEYTTAVETEIYKALEGGWNSLEEGGSYWKFEDGQYWWYKSYDDLDDNYWYGTTEIIIGLDGIEQLDLNVAGITAEIMEGKMREEDIYTIICKPSKIISGGVDKSDTNIKEGQTLTYVWILVDKGEEGIIAETLHLSSYDTYYYKKIEE